MRLVLPETVHAVAIDDDVVFLNVLSDIYYCLAGATQAMTLAADGSVTMHDRQAAASLVQAGLLVEDGQGRIRRVPQRPTRSLAWRGKTMTPLGLRRAWRANACAARAVEALNFSDLLALAAPSADKPTEPDAPCLGAEALEREAARFARHAPWLPRDGVCMMRSLQQLLYLRAYGFRPSWVFGVRTWPFQAHCWLQSGATVLDDHVEHVSAYAPILAV